MKSQCTECVDIRYFIKWLNSTIASNYFLLLFTETTLTKCQWTVQNLDSLLAFICLKHSFLYSLYIRKQQWFCFKSLLVLNEVGASVYIPRHPVPCDQVWKHQPANAKMRMLPTSTWWAEVLLWVGNWENVRPLVPFRCTNRLECCQAKGVIEQSGPIAQSGNIATFGNILPTWAIWNSKQSHNTLL